MTAIDRTAYPRPGSRLTREELRARYTLTETDLTFIRLCARGEIGRLMLATLLKARQDVGYFPVTEEVHADTRKISTDRQCLLSKGCLWPVSHR